jgi:type II secretory pathway pseudopilin PulG
VNLRRIRSGAPALHQRGFALIAMLVLAAMITAFLITLGLNRSSVEIANEREDRSMSALRQAKAALIAYAASEQWQFHLNPPPTGYYQPGALPCPDKDDDDGFSDCTGSTARSMIGRLPWQTLGIEDLRDSSGERLWYAVSQDFRKLQCPTTNCTTINSDTQGQISVIGKIAMNNVVAVVIAPGPIILGQTRPATLTAPAHNDPANYVEGFTSGDWVHFSFATNGLPDQTLNDRLLVITQADLMAAVEPVVAAQIARDVKPILNTFSSQWGAFPYPANFSPDPGTSGGTTTRSPMNFVGDTTQSAGLLPISAVPVSAASNTSPIIVTTASPHTSSTGDLVWVYGVQGNTSANGEFIVTVIDSTHLVLNSSSGNGNYTGGGAVTITYPWSLYVVTQVSGSGTIDNLNCVNVSFPGLRCTFQAHPVTCGSYPCISSLGFQLQAQAGTNVGRTLAVLPDLTTINANTKLDGLLTTFLSTSIAGQLPWTTGMGVVKYSATLPTFCGVAPPCNGTYTVEVTLPDVTTNRTINADKTSAIGWFIANEWYRQTYYALAPDMQPGGNSNCSANPPCLTVNKLPGGAVTNGQAILLLAGRALNGSNRPSAMLNNYVEGANQTALATFTYESRSGTPTSINDRVVVVAP